MTHIAKEPVRMEIDSCPEHLPVVRSAVERVCQWVGFAESQTGKVVLSTDEALTNIIRHAYKGCRGQPIQVELVPLIDGTRTGIRIVLRDRGETVDADRIRSRDLDDVRPGGLGVHIIQQCMDEVAYTPADGGGTVLTMIKWRTDPENESEPS